MILNKKFFLSVAAISLAAFSSFAESASVTADDIYEEDYGIYFKLGYNTMYPTATSKFTLSCVAGTDKCDDKASKDMQIRADTLAKTKFDYNFMGANVSIGKFIDSQMSADLEVSVQYGIKQTTDGDSVFKDSETLYSGLFINGNYALTTDDIKPYVSLGLGGALTNTSHDSYKAFNTMSYYLGAQAKAGVAYAATKMLSPYVNYKFVYLCQMSDAVQVNDLDKSGTLHVDIKTSFMLHNIEAGLVIHNF